MRIQILLCALLIHLCSSCDFLPSITCPKRSREALCQCSKTKKSGGLVCCHISSDYVLKESIGCEGMKNDTKHVYLYNATLENFDASLKTWIHLDSLTIIESNIKKITGGFTGSLKCVNISSNNISEIDSKVFKNLNKLHTLNISNNGLDKVPKLNMRTENFTLDVSENPQLKCADIKAQADDNPTTNLKFINTNTTKCLHISNFKWFNSTLSVTLDQVKTRKKLEQECPRGPNYKCTCAPYRMFFVDDRAMNTIKVNCSGLHLTELPSLPENTGLLDVSRNNITSLDRIATDPSYHAMRELIADNNKIDSITSIEGSKFIDNFATLSLRENSLKTIPIYILSNTFDRNYQTRQVKLGGNKLNCDCSTAQVLKLWLLANTEHIPDYDELLCEKDLEKVKNIDHSKMCVYQKDWTDYIYYIIAGEIILLLLLISKVSYDYWVFKTSGYLPWPASNMPKLPCDWVFET